MWRISAELVTIVSSYGRGGKNYFHLMSWQPDVFHLCFFLAPMQHFATLSSARALTRPSPCCCRRRKWSRLAIYGRDKVVPRQLDESLCGRCPHKGRPAHAASHAPRHDVIVELAGLAQRSEQPAFTFPASTAFGRGSEMCPSSKFLRQRAGQMEGGSGSFG